MERRGEKIDDLRLRKKSLRLRVSASPRRILSFFLLFFLAWIFLAPFLAENLIVEKPLQRADAILILGGSQTFIERTNKAAELFKNGRAPKIFLTDDGLQGGWNRAERKNLFFAEQARRELLNRGVPDNAIEILPTVVKSTHDEAVLFANEMREKNLKTILIVTSPYHTRRAFSTFEKVLHENSEAIIEVGIESPPTGAQSPPPRFWWLSPKGWNFVALEYLKIVYYWLFY